MKTISILAAISIVIGWGTSSNAQCRAAFTYVIKGGQTIELYNSSSPSAGLSYKWIAPSLTFTNGTSDNSPSPVFWASVKGEYKIRLIVSNITTGCTDTSTCDVKVNLSNWCADVVADFDYKINNGVALLTEKSLPVSNSIKKEIYWNSWPENIQQLDNRAKLSVLKEGLYAIKLHVLDKQSSCRDSIIKVLDLKKSVRKCKAGFSYAHTFPSTIFKDSSYVENPMNSIKTWDFGDGNQLTTSFFSSSPTHIYKQASTYLVRLIIEDTVLNCKDSAFQNLVIHNKCKAEFNRHHVNKSVLFTPGKSRNEQSTTYKWFFGDNDSSISKQPYHTYDRSGFYTVCLMISDTANKCGDTICETIYVADNYNFNCSSDFRAMQWNTPGDIKFIMASSGIDPNTIFSWSFHDGTSANGVDPGKLYLQEGDFSVSLKVENRISGCSDSLNRKIFIRFPKIDSTNLKCWGAPISNELNEPINQREKLMIFPNPSTGVYNLRSNIIFENTLINVYNTAGVLVHSIELNERSINKVLDLSNCIDGVYLIQVKNDYGVETRRVIKN